MAFDGQYQPVSADIDWDNPDDVRERAIATDEAIQRVIDELGLAVNEPGAIRMPDGTTLDDALEDAKWQPGMITVFWGGLSFSGWNILWTILKYVTLLVIIVVIRNTNPRVRIDQAIRFLWGPMTILAIIGMALAALGF